ncbi:MAG TPA: (deoxy)nucleoside triphosphate pyrophosphohydrolase [Myxococcales bacterium]|nr:NUDIX hydrolase [Myxococcales bacterium]HAN31374.1 (deoxy)nucleoside triphosphate pyrophosphohydrolase [Myxococcales bacterium]
MESTDALPVVPVVAAEILDEQGRYLIAQRNAHAVMPLLWEFPGGRVRQGEREQDALVRCLKATLGITVECVDRKMTVSKPYQAYQVQLAVWSCHIVQGEPQCLYVHDFRWVRTEELSTYSFPPADQQSVDELLGFTAQS